METQLCSIIYLIIYFTNKTTAIKDHNRFNFSSRRFIFFIFGFKFLLRIVVVQGYATIYREILTGL